MALGRARWRARRVGTVLLVVIAALLCAQVGPALAGLSATRVKAQTVRSAKWSVVFSAAPATTSTTGTPTTSLDTDTYWWISNNGTTTLSPSYSVTISLTTTDGATAQLEECRGVETYVTNNWDESTGACTGVVNVVAYSGTPANYVVPAHYPAGAAIRWRVHVTAGVPGATATLSVTVTR